MSGERQSMSSQDGPVRLGTMGMFIIDTFQFIDPVTGQDLGNKGLKEQIGGGGCYFAIGARVWLAPQQIQMIVDRGPDWSSEHQAVLDRYDQNPAGPSSRSMWHFRTRPDGTTRALNLYTGDQRGFQYLSPKIRLDPADLLTCSPVTPPRLPEWVHLICSPERALAAFADMRNICQKDQTQIFPKIIYEPIPDSCVPENMSECLEALKSVTVFSPNHEEAASLLGLTAAWQAKLKSPDAITHDALDFIEHELACAFATLLPEQNGAMNACGPIICIRSGAWGSVVGTGGIGFTRVPAWHAHSTSPAAAECSSTRVVDVTGAGNAFLGGFAAHLVNNDNGDHFLDRACMVEAAMHGAVSAALVIEQLGLPQFNVHKAPEPWNSTTATSRLSLLKSRLIDTNTIAI